MSHATLSPPPHCATLQDPRNKTTWHSLTLAQLDFWEEFRFHPDTPVSTVAHGTLISGPINGVALARAITQTTQEADVLALRFHQESGADPVQCVDETRRPLLREIDLRHTDDPQKAARDLMQADIDAPLDLAHDPLSAQWLLRLADTQWFWYERGHHIILDGYSMALIEQRCAALYAHFIGQGSAGEPLKPFVHYLSEEADYRASPRHVKDGDFWRNELGGDPSNTAARAPHRLPVLQKGGESYGTAMHEAVIPLHDRLLPALKTMGAAQGLHWPDLLTLLSGFYLSRHLTPAETGTHTGAVPRAIWLPFMSRLGSVSAAIPALVVNILPLSIELDPQDSLATNIRKHADRLRKLRRHGRYRIEQIAADQGLGKGERFFFSPLINVLPFDPPQFWGCEAQREVLAAGPGDGVNMTFAARSDAEDLHLILEVDPAVMPRKEFDAHAARLPAFFEAATSQPEGSIPLLDAIG
ncbi:condensation domain-containing protein [Albirhodobacter sp. R86504]|uniref:condensation domain-containing protein n=1 Tax=Albirhodobacter sp. R86504 TaxID=3093848 RepID=UPI00367163A2